MLKANVCVVRLVSWIFGMYLFFFILFHFNNENVATMNYPLAHEQIMIFTGQKLWTTI